MRIFLIRHGYSEGNADPANYGLRGDPHVRLTDKGWQQSIAAGAFLKDYLARHPSRKPESKLRVWSSTYRRTRETTAGLLQGLDGLVDRNDKDAVRVSLRLIEMDFGLFSQYHSEEERMQKMPLEAAFYNAARERAKFYAQPPMGESPMDVLHRVEPFIGTLQRDRERGTQDVVVVTHGVTLRTLAMAYLHIDPDKYNDFKNPQNTSIYMIDGDRDTGYVFKQIYNGETGQEVNIDWGAKLAGVKIPEVPAHLRKPPFAPVP